MSQTKGEGETEGSGRLCVRGRREERRGGVRCCVEKMEKWNGKRVVCGCCVKKRGKREKGREVGCAAWGGHVLLEKKKKREGRRRGVLGWERKKGKEKKKR